MNNKTIMIGVIALAILGFAAFQFMGNGSSDDKMAVKPTILLEEDAGDSDVTDEIGEDGRMGDSTATGNGSDTSADSSEAGDEYANGEYTAVGSYEAPPGEEQIGVTVTLEDGVIVDSSLELLGKHEVSVKMQKAFESGYKELIIGKKIDEVDLDVVAGSSLTSGGFEDALQQIMEDARS